MKDLKLAFIEENMGGIFMTVDLAMIFLQVTPKEKKDEFYLLIKLKTLLIKQHYQGSEKATYRIGEVFMNHVSDKELISRVHIKSYNSMTAEKKISKGLEQTFL